MEGNGEKKEWEIEGKSKRGKWEERTATGREGKGRDLKDKQEKMVERTCRIGTKVDEGRQVVFSIG